MNKEDRLQWIKKRHQLHETSDVVLPTTQRDVDEEAGLMDSFGEFNRDRQSNKKALTSDEG